MSSSRFLGAALYSLLQQTHTTCHELVQRTHLPENYLTKIIYGEREPHAMTVLYIARVLPVPPGDLINEIDRLTREYEETGVLPAIVQDLAAHRRKN